MAKSKSFFGQRRGSTKSLTFQVLRGMQITKDRVQEVANPQTTGQMPTRVSLAVVSKAAARLMPLIGMSFEGAGNPVDNRRRFMSENMRHMRQLFISSANKRGTSPIYARQAYGIPKGYAAIVPNKYIISKGSLVTPPLFTPYVQWNGAGVDAFATIDSVCAVGENMASLPFGTYTAGQILGKIFGLQPTDQVTYVAVITEDGESYVYNGLSEIGFMTRFGEMISRRIVFTDPGVNIEINASTDKAALEQYIASCTDADRTDQLAINVLLNDLQATVDGNAIKIGWGAIDPDTLLADKEDNYTTRACGWFVSRLDKLTNQWRYSNCELSLAMQPYTEVDVESEYNWYGVPYYIAVQSYYKAGSATASDKYTQQGGDDDSLGF